MEIWGVAYMLLISMNLHNAKKGMSCKVPWVFLLITQDANVISSFNDSVQKQNFLCLGQNQVHKASPKGWMQIQA